MRRRLTGIVLTTVLFSGGILSAQAAEQLGTIAVVMDHAGASAQGAQVSLCYAGSPSEDGYRLTEFFGGGFVRREDAQSSDLAKWLSATAAGAGENQYLEEDGTAEFSGLHEGLYLLEQTRSARGFRCVAPFLIPVPCNGDWEVTALPKMQEIFTQSPKTGQHPAPIIGAMGLILSGMGLAACWDKIRKNR